MDQGVPNPDNSSSSSSLAIIAAAVGGAVVILVVIIAVVLIKREKRKTRGMLVSGGSSSVSVVSDPNSIPMEVVRAQDFRVANNGLHRGSAVSASSETASVSGSSTSGSSSGYYGSAFGSASGLLPSFQENPYSVNAYSTQKVTGEIYNDSIYPTYAECDYHEYGNKVLAEPSIRNQLLLEKSVLGEGQFGLVKLGHLKISAVPEHCKGLIPEKNDGYLHCAVKILKESANEKNVLDFTQEAKMMASFNHKNVVKVIAFLCEQTPFMLVTEFIRYSDLQNMLRKSNVEGLLWNTKEFLHVLHQIAEGMEYLQSVSFIHRDLAARNCLVHSDLVVKISDFGLSRELAVDNDYYKVQTKGKLPIKWMSPEALGYRRFSHASDVWAYGVVMWEVFEYGHSPYPQVNPRDMLAFLESGERLSCPKTCMSNPSIYEFMLRCWEADITTRATFAECRKFCWEQLQSPAISSLEIRDIGLMLMEM